MRWTTRVSGLLAGGLLAGLFFAATAPAQKMHEDNVWGFKMRVPSGWREIPLKVNERWIIGKYQSDRSYVSEEGMNHKPEMKVLVFPEAVKKDRKSRVKVEDDGETIRVQLKHRYKDYKAYLKGNFAGGGYFFSKEEEGKIGDVEVSMYEIKIEKLSYVGKQRIIAWVFHLPDADVAVDFNVLENRYRRLKSTCLSALKSFGLADRTGKAEQRSEGATLETISKKKWEKMSPIERMKYRKEKAERVIKQAVENLPDGWKTKSSPHFEVLTHADMRFTKKMIGQAEAIRDWLDKNFFEIGEDYVPRAILRICVDSAEENAYRKGSSDAFSLDSREIVVSKRTDFGRRSELEFLSAGINEQWFSDRNRLLYEYMPGWFRYGMRQYVGTAVAKGKKLVFKPDDWERDVIRKGEREDKLVANRDILKMTWKEFQKAYRASSGVLTMQCGSLVRYLMSPKCRRDKRTKDILIKYLRNLHDVAKEIEAKEEKEKGKSDKAKTAKEERELRKKNQEENEKRSRHIVDEAFKRTFGDWDDKDWQKFEKGWQKATL